MSAGADRRAHAAEALARVFPWILLAIFCAIPILGMLARSLAGRLVWTVVVAALPLFIVLVGYHRWRRICPLYFFARIPVLLGIQRRRRASKRLEANYYYVAFALFFISLWLRLTATNGDGYAIAVFFVGIATLAFGAGFLFTGRTWCNYFCPVSFIEKIYTEPRGLATTTNSQCSTCTACKSACPDINQENGYWKEIGLRSKRLVYFAFPGLVFGFYFYFFLQSDTWDYYFSGRWTHEPGLVSIAFLPGQGAATAGFSFLPQMPRALAAALTLAVCGCLSLAIFWLLERAIAAWQSRRSRSFDAQRLRHILFSVAAFAAFVIFYSFAGQPTLRRLPGAASIAIIVVVAVATLFVRRRLLRAQTDFAEEAVARGIVKRWQWVDIQPPADPHEALLVYKTRATETKRGYVRALEAYGEAVRETMADGYVTPRQVVLLNGLRRQLEITDADQERLLGELREEERARLDEPERQMLPEKHLQLETYGRALARHLGEQPAPAADADDDYIRRLRAEYRVTAEEHAAVLADLLGGGEALQQSLQRELALIEQLAAAARTLSAEVRQPYGLLALVAERERDRAAGRLRRYLGLPYDAYDAAAGKPQLAGLGFDAPSEREAVVFSLCASLPPGFAKQLEAAYITTESARQGPISLDDAARLLAGGADAYGRAIGLYALADRGLAGAETLRQAEGDEHELVAETARGLAARGKGGEDSRVGERLLTVERMLALHGAPASVDGGLRLVSVSHDEHSF